MYPALAGIPGGLFEKIGMPVVIQLWIGIFSINRMFNCQVANMVAETLPAYTAL